MAYYGVCLSLSLSHTHTRAHIHPTSSSHPPISLQCQPTSVCFLPVVIIIQSPTHQRDKDTHVGVPSGLVSRFCPKLRSLVAQSVIVHLQKTGTHWSDTGANREEAGTNHRRPSPHISKVVVMTVISSFIEIPGVVKKKAPKTEPCATDCP